MFLENFTRLVKYYGKGRYLKLSGFFVLSFIAGLLEFLGIALIYPFIMLIINPEKTFFNLPHLPGNHLVNALVIGFLVLCIFVFKNIFMLFVQYIQNKFIANWKKDITKKFIEYYLYAPYKDTMKISAGDKIFMLSVACNMPIDNFIMRFLNLMTNGIIILMIISLLMVKFPVAAITTFLFTLVCMFAQNKFLKKRTQLIAENLAKESKKYNDSIFENIYNLKEIKILSAEKIFYDNHAKTEDTYRDIHARSTYYSNIPPYLTEIIIVIALLLLSFVISMQNLTDNASLVASFAVIGASLFRIAPALQRLQTSLINMNASREFVKMMNDNYENYNLGNLKTDDTSYEKRLDFRNRVELKNINFSYKEDNVVINNLSLEINKGDFIGVIGLSGAGKSTLADILLGLLPADSGEMTVDGLKLTDKNHAYFRNIIGYVPQQINILEKSIKENIAWGSPKINEEGVIKALKAAQIYEFVETLPDGISSKISQNNMSQGQKQRLAIARALYRDPEILIFDEATSALDVQVEHEITEMLKELSHSKTIIAIAHRLSTLKSCNKLVYLRDGKIVDIGTFSELSGRHSDFENLVKLSSLE